MAPPTRDCITVCASVSPSVKWGWDRAVWSTKSSQWCSVQTQGTAGIEPPHLWFSHPKFPHSTPRYSPLLGEMSVHTDTTCQVAPSSQATAPLTAWHHHRLNTEVNGPVSSQGAAAQSLDVPSPTSEV